MDDNKAKKRPVDEAGIRLAPTPLRSDDMNVLPPIRQDFIIAPQLEINEKEELGEETTDSTLKDYQPKKEDMSKKWKRIKRGKNMLYGTLILLATIFALLPYILGAASVSWSLPFKYIPSEFNAILNFINAFKDTAEVGWSGEEVGSIWIQTIPDMILLIGIIALAINFIKSIYALLAAVREVKYIWGSVVYLVCIIIVFIMSLIGDESIGVEKIEFIDDFINNCSNCEMFTMVITSIGYLVVCIVINFVNRDKQGYLI